METVLIPEFPNGPSSIHVSITMRATVAKELHMKSGGLFFSFLVILVENAHRLCLGSGSNSIYKITVGNGHGKSRVPINPHHQ